MTRHRWRLRRAPSGGSMIFLVLVAAVAVSCGAVEDRGVDDLLAPTALETTVDRLNGVGVECTADVDHPATRWDGTTFEPETVYTCDRDGSDFVLAGFGSRRNVVAARSVLLSDQCEEWEEIAASWISFGEWVLDVPDQFRDRAPDVQHEVGDLLDVDVTVVPCDQAGLTSDLVERLQPADQWSGLAFGEDDELTSLSDAIATNAITYSFGEWVELDNDVAFHVSNPRIDPESAHYLLVDVRMENRSADEEHGVLGLGLVCAGSTDLGFSRPDSSYSTLGLLPPLAYRDGTLALTGDAPLSIDLEPAGVPCDGPARLRVEFGDLFSFDASYDDNINHDYLVPDELLEEFNAS